MDTLVWAWLCLTTAIPSALAQGNIATVTELLALTPGVNGSVALVAGRITANDGGGGNFVYYSASAVATNEGTIFKPDNANGRWLREGAAKEVFPEYFGNGADAIQKALDFTRSTGVTTKLQSKVYAMSQAITWQSATPNNSIQTWLLEGNGATLDFSASGITSGSLFTVGATSTANLNERGYLAIRNLSILGSEPTNPINVVTNATTTTGLDILNALDVRLDNVLVRMCYKGLRTYFAFPVSASKVNSRNNFIGLHLDSTSTLGNWTSFSATECHYGLLVMPSAGDEIVSDQTFYQPRIESCLVGVHVDPLNAGNVTGVRSLSIDQIYSEFITYDVARLGLVWTFATPQTRGANRTRLIVNTRFTGGNVDSAWTGTHAPIVFASNNTVTGGVFEFPAQVGDFVSYPTNSWVRALVDQDTPLAQPYMITPSGGRVGVGTNAPAKPLHISDGNFSYGLRVENTGGTTAGIDFRNIGSGANPVSLGAFNNTFIVETANATRLNVDSSGLTMLIAGEGFRLKEGSNARMGVSTLVNGTVTVSNTSITANTRIFATRQAVNGSTTIGTLEAGTKVVGTSFVINSYTALVGLSADDDSIVAWLLVEPSP